MNKWSTGGPDDKTCGAFTGSLTSVTFGNSTHCDGPTDPSTVVYNLGDCGTCHDIKHSVCASQCAGANLAFDKALVQQLCKSPTDVCITGYFSELI